MVREILEKGQSVTDKLNHAGDRIIWENPMEMLDDIWLARKQRDELKQQLDNTIERREIMDTYRFRDIKTLQDQIASARQCVEQAMEEVYAVQAYIESLKDKVRFLEQENERLSVLLSRVQ